MIHLLVVFVSVLAELNLLLSVLGPFLQLLATLCLCIASELLFLLLFAVECMFPFFILSNDTLDTLSFLLIKIFFSIALGCEAWATAPASGLESLKTVVREAESGSVGLRDSLATIAYRVEVTK